ncbi:MAG: NADP-dependent oxidoreductase [Micrococcaceae bacterium]|nr:NADP-dependent oxidoreductase [Micrococcaceae bacterium]MDN5812039.1 NADP-dependent oxidoreductase [Micrococcaceae bacterium]MDN5879170.1 NADP-dependent oxidoreductase [Micrococcaceae bacterium]MDN5886598.1 NADP-dependent oxidoreductase [Micrococcaceae bacterium]MDN5904788.1 NADP-dependent oxidoreductase [Micrococcaceae bacterium]
MRAMTYSKYGSNDVLELTELPVPKVGPGEVRIRVTHASVNPVDWKIMSGGLDGLMDAHFPVIPGWDVAGVVDAVGPDVPEFASGDRVAAYARKQVVSGGTFAEYVTVFAVDVAAVPEGVTQETAAALPLTGLTAQRSLEALDVLPGERLLLHAASGGVGFLAAQLAIATGAEVVGTASVANHEKLTALGVTPVAHGDGLGERLRDIAPDGFDKVADYAGGVLDTTLTVLKDGGRHVSIADPGVIEHGGRWLWVRPDGSRLGDLLDQVAAGSLEVVIDTVYGLEALATAFSASQQGAARGKLVLHIAD